MEQGLQHKLHNKNNPKNAFKVFKKLRQDFSPKHRNIQLELGRPTVCLIWVTLKQDGRDALNQCGWIRAFCQQSSACSAVRRVVHGQLYAVRSAFLATAALLVLSAVAELSLCNSTLLMFVYMI